MNTLLHQLAAHRGFVVYRASDKHPVDPAGFNSDAQDSRTWMLPADAQAVADSFGGGHGVGLVLYRGSGLFCVDIDHCILSGARSEHAQGVLARFPGAFVEVSLSGAGLHVFGLYTGEAPAHSCKNAYWSTELYTEARYIALTGTEATGALIDCTDALRTFAAEYFPPTDRGHTGEWNDGPAPGWDFIRDDAQLIQWALKHTTAAQTFGSKATFAALYLADADALAALWPHESNGYDASSADLALADYLAYLTGNDHERVLRLMQGSGLARPKYERDDYIRGTVARACSKPREWPRLTRSAPPPAPEQPAPDAYTTLCDKTDKGNANLLVRLVGGDLRYVAETRHWLRWDGSRWHSDPHETFVTTQAVEVARWYRDEAKRMEAAGTGDSLLAAEELAKWAAKSRNKAAIDNMIALARRTIGVPLSVNDLDRNPWLLGVDNGVVNLRTGELRETEAREEFVTKRSVHAYDPAAAAPRWEQLVAEITGEPIPPDRDADGHVVPDTVGRFNPRPDLARYLQKALGYSITGSTGEQKFFVAIGDGSNGKGVLFDTVKAVLGPYAVVLPAEALMASKHDGDAERPTSLAASLAGSRLVVASESKEGQRLNTSMIKSHTGDKEMTARKMRQDAFTFTITHKLWLLTNVRPALDHIDAATKGRLHFIPFDRRWNRPGEVDRNPELPDGEKGLMEHLLQVETAGILAWLVRGAVLYAAEGLVPPAAVASLTRDYMREQDTLGRWLEGMQRVPPKQGTGATELLQAYGSWCASESVAMSHNTATGFGRALAGRGVETGRSSTGVMWGLRRK